MINPLTLIPTGFLGKLKIAAVVVVGFVVTILYALLQRSEKKREVFKAKVAEKTHQVKEKASQALTDGLQKESVKQAEPVDTTDRNHFG